MTVQFIVQNEAWQPLIGVRVKAVDNQSGRILSTAISDRQGVASFPTLEQGGNYRFEPEITRTSGQTGKMTNIGVSRMTPVVPPSVAPIVNTTNVLNSSTTNNSLEAESTVVCVTWSVLFAGDGTLPYVAITIGDFNTTFVVPSKNGQTTLTFPASGELDYTVELNGGSGDITVTEGACEA